MITKNIYDYITYITNTLKTNIACVSFEDGYEFIIYTNFEPSNSGGSTTIDYCELRGIFITDLIRSTTLDMRISKQSFLTKYEDYIKIQEEVNIKFNKNIPYMLFVS